MPHLTLEYSANLDHQYDLAQLCRVLKDAVLASGLFETGAVRVRALRTESYSLADDDPRNGFLDASLRIGVGRSLAQQKQIGNQLMEVMAAFFAPSLAEPYFALSLEIREISAELSWKKNSLHPRFRVS